MDLRQARQRTLAKLDELRSALRPLLGPHFELYVVGALRTGLYVGPKPAARSPNAACPFPRVIEVDLRLVLHGAHPHDDAILSAIQTRLGIPAARKTNTVHWHLQDVPMAVFYWYETITHDLAFEWELCVNASPFVDIAVYWEHLFTPDEQAYLKRNRAALANEDLPLGAYIQFKRRQMAEGRWRLVASYALHRASRVGPLNCTAATPITGLAPPPVDDLVAQWFRGDRTQPTLERPGLMPSAAIRHMLSKRDGLQRLGPLPREPDWVTVATQHQQEINTSLST